MNNLNNELLDEEIALWKTIVKQVQVAMNLSDEEATKVENHKLVRMFGLLPSFAGCPNPVGTGFLNVTVYLAERKGGRDLFLHNQEHDSDILSRLQPFRNIMCQGDQAVVEKGLSLASLVMLKDYKEDVQTDTQNRKYNPIASGAWDFDQVRGRLVSTVKKVRTRRLDAVFALSMVVMTWWNIA
jgi:hypothetical protein